MCKRAKETIKKNKLLDACINGKGDFFKEIKRMRKCPKRTATSMDGKVEDIPSHFRDQYSSLYNEVHEDEELTKMKAAIKCRVSCEGGSEVDKVTPFVI